MRIKEQRWYEIKGDQVFIYDRGYPEQSVSVSIVCLKDLSYYRSNFNLNKVWSIY